MRKTLCARLEAGRMGRESGIYATAPGSGPMGAFTIQGPCGAALRILATPGDLDDAMGWEHVSVSTKRRLPNWTEMAFVKDLFWDDEECVVEFHPPRSAYVANHPNCLHLWRHISLSFPMPPTLFVGSVAAGELSDHEGRTLRELAEKKGEQLSVEEVDAAVAVLRGER